MDYRISTFDGKKLWKNHLLFYNYRKPLFNSLLNFVQIDIGLSGSDLIRLYFTAKLLYRLMSDYIQPN